MRKGILLLGISVGLSFAVECKYYRIREGDTLEKIAKREGVSVESLKSANRDLDEKRLKIGQSICVPVKVSQKRTENRYAVYEVKKGDTLQKIAESFGVDVKTLKEFNNLKTDRLVEGQKIKIPPRTASARPEREGRQNYELYTVKRGARLEHVARATGVPLKELERLNPELKDKWLPAGTKVKLPPRETKQADTGRYDLYKVKRGGRLEDVARATGVPLKELERLNPELKGKWLEPGTVVRIPKAPQRVARQEDQNYELYTVKRGARLEHVARATGVPLKELERLNPELKDKWLPAGTKVKLPPRETKQAVIQKPQKPQEEAEPTVSRKAERSIVGEPEKETVASALPKGLSLQLPVEGRVTRVPKGIEISAPCSSPVKAVEDGRVIYSGGDLQAYGNMVIIEHDRFISLYAYNETNLVRRGDRVSKGQIIARVGKKSNSEECALRFELRNKEGIPLNPTDYIKDLQ